MEYLELELQFENPDFSEILIAELSEAGFDYFIGDEHILKAYIATSEFKAQKLSGCYFLNKHKDRITIRQRYIASENWNRKWEENFDPVLVENAIYVRAPFHEPRPDLPMEILIMPKMSFGTGHHSTTYLMLKQMLELDLRNKKVADLGCGSGILSIAAAKMGAWEITAIDIDKWCYNNSRENAEVNNVKNMVIKQGTAIDLEGKFDVVLANINRNVLLAEMDIYADLTATGGTLLLSGFYMEDRALVEEVAAGAGFEVQKARDKNNWMVLQLSKS